MLRIKAHNPEKPRRAKNLTDHDWAPFKDDITEYHTLQYKRDLMIERLKVDHGFAVTHSQLNRQMGIWGLRVNKRSTQPPPPELAQIPEESGCRSELSQLAPAAEEDILASSTSSIPLDNGPLSTESPLSAHQNLVGQEVLIAPDPHLQHSHAGESSDASSSSSVFSSGGDTSSTHTSPSQESASWREISKQHPAQLSPSKAMVAVTRPNIEDGFQLLADLVDGSLGITPTSWIHELWQNILPSPELINMAYLDSMTQHADCLSAGGLRRSAFDLHGLCFRACYHLLGRKLLLLCPRVQSDGTSPSSLIGQIPPEGSEDLRALRCLMRCAIGTARACATESESRYAIRLLEASVYILDILSLGVTDVARTLLRLYQLLLEDRFPGAKGLTSRARDVEVLSENPKPVLSVDPLTVIHPAIRHREYLFLSSNTRPGSFGRSALRIEIASAFPIINKRASHFASSGCARAKALDFLRWCSETISDNRKVLDGACPIHWPFQTDNKAHQRNIENNAQQALFWLLVKERERSTRQGLSWSSASDISSARDYFDGFGMNTLEGFAVIVKLILNGSSCAITTDRTDAMLVPDNLLIPDTLSSYCLRKTQMMGVSTFPQDYLDHIGQIFERPEDALGDTARILGHRYARSMMSDTPFPLAVDIANEDVQAGDSANMAILQAIKTLNLSFQKPSWRQKLMGKRAIEETVPADTTLAPALLSARSSSQMSLDTRSFLDTAHSAKLKQNRSTGSLRMSISSRGFSSRTSGAMSIDSRDSFTHNTGMPHAPPPMEPDVQDLKDNTTTTSTMGGWEAAIDDEATWI